MTQSTGPASSPGKAGWSPSYYVYITMKTANIQVSIIYLISICISMLNTLLIFAGSINHFSSFFFGLDLCVLNPKKMSFILLST